MTTANVYATIDDVRDILSAAAVILRADDGSPTAYGGAIAKAGNKVDFYLHRRYATEDLATSDLVKDWAAALAAYYLCTRRGNPPPEGVVIHYKSALEDMKAVQKGQNDIPGIGMRKSHVPGMSKMRATLKPTARAVVEKSQGTHGSGEAADIQRPTDPWDRAGANNRGIMDNSI